MKILRKLICLAVFFCGLVLVTSARGQTATFSYDDHSGAPNAGSYSPGSSFTFSITLAFTAGGNIANLEGLTYHFTQQNPSGPFNFAITLRDATGSQFTFLQTPSPAYPENMTPQNPDDLGGSLQGTTGVGNGSYFIANLTISIAASAAPGTYVIQNSTTGGGTSFISDDIGHTFAIPQAIYTITVVPEPTTLSLLVVAGAGAAAFGFLRRSRR